MNKKCVIVVIGFLLLVFFPPAMFAESICKKSKACEAHEDDKYPFGFYSESKVSGKNSLCVMVDKRNLMQRILKSIEFNKNFPKDLMSICKQRGLNWKDFTSPALNGSLVMLHENLKNNTINNGTQFRGKCGQKGPEYIAALLGIGGALGGFKSGTVKIIEFLPNAEVQIDYNENGRTIKREYKGSSRWWAWYKPEKQTDKTLCPTKVAIDTDSDGIVDKWDYYENCKTIRREVDTKINGRYDGKPDKWYYFNPSMQSGNTLCTVKSEHDRNGDGIVDEWDYYENCKITRREVDTKINGRYDGKPDKWYHYNPSIQSGNTLCTVTVEQDTNGNGVADYREYFENCKMLRSETDANENGIAESVCHYLSGKFSRCEEIGANEMKKAKSFRDAGNTAEAEKWYIRAIEAYTKEWQGKNKWINNSIADCHIGIGGLFVSSDEAKAVRHFNHAVSLGDKYNKSSACNRIGDLYADKNNFLEAEKWFSRSIRLNSSLENLAYSVNMLSRTRKGFEERIKAIDGEMRNVKDMKLATTEEKNSLAFLHYLKGRIYHLKNDNKTALLNFAAVEHIKENGTLNDVGFWVSYSWSLFCSRKLNEALKKGLRGYDIDNKNLNSLWNIGTYQWLLGNTDEAKKWLTRAINADRQLVKNNLERETKDIMKVFPKKRKLIKEYREFIRSNL